MNLALQGFHVQLCKGYHYRLNVNSILGERETEKAGDKENVIDFSNKYSALIAKGQSSFGSKLCYRILEANSIIKLFWPKIKESQ